jgi:hypothetical protein
MMEEQLTVAGMVSRGRKVGHPLGPGGSCPSCAATLPTLPGLIILNLPPS